MNNEELLSLISKCRENKNLYGSSCENLLELVKCKEIPEWITESLWELFKNEDWEEINNRFYTNLAFGTGGMRGRTIGSYVTKAEKGQLKTKKRQTMPLLEVIP